VLKNQLIRLRTTGEEAFGVTLPPSENCEYSVLLQFDGGWVGRLKLSSVWANLHTGLYFLTIAEGRNFTVS